MSHQIEVGFYYYFDYDVSLCIFLILTNVYLKVGIVACQMAKARGLTVIGTAGSEEGVTAVKQQTGADFVFNHRKEGYMDKIMVHTLFSYLI